MASSSGWRVSQLASAVLSVAVVFLLLVLSTGSEHFRGPPNSRARSVHGGGGSRSLSSSFHRKLLQQEQHAGGGGGGRAAETDRMGNGGCSKDNIVVYQGATAPMPNGIPTYTVQVLNVCLGGEGCGGAGGGIAGVHLNCGWFSSARLINPRIFRRLGYNDCLINDGRTIPAGGSISFQYANSFAYPLAVSSVSCLSPPPHRK